MVGLSKKFTPSLENRNLFLLRVDSGNLSTSCACPESRTARNNHTPSLSFLGDEEGGGVELEPEFFRRKMVVVLDQSEVDVITMGYERDQDIDGS